MTMDGESYEHVRQSLQGHKPYMASFSNLHGRCKECKRWPNLDGLVALCDKHRCKRCSHGIPTEGPRNPDSTSCPQCQLELIYPEAKDRPPGHGMLYEDFNLVEDTLSEVAFPPVCGNTRPANAENGGACGTEAAFFCVHHKLFLCKKCYRPHMKESDEDENEYEALRYLTVDEYLGRVTMKGYDFTRKEDEKWRRCHFYQRDHENAATGYCQQCDRFLCRDCALLHRRVDSPSDSHKIQSIHLSLDDMENKMKKERDKYQAMKEVVDGKRASNDAHLSRMQDQYEHVKAQINSTYDEIERRLKKDRDTLLMKLKEGQEWIEDQLGQEKEKLGDAFTAVAASDVVCDRMLEGNQAKKTAGLVHLHQFHKANGVNLGEFFGEHVREHSREVLDFLGKDRGFCKNEHLVTAMTENKGTSNILGKLLGRDVTVDLNY
ncbi:protein PML-like isoform X2 [Lineus longissimus]|uniref:protein PML-like isoform X2 n=1 Tax=Lineus longissimus TaxID=88925 RepID=UPI00315C4E8F